LDQIHQPSSLLAIPSHRKGKKSLANRQKKSEFFTCFYLKLTIYRNLCLPGWPAAPAARPAPQPAWSAQVRARHPHHGKVWE